MRSYSDFCLYQRTKYASKALEYLICYYHLSPAEYEILVLLCSSREATLSEKSSEAFLMHDCAQPSSVGGVEEERNLAKGTETY